MGHSTKAHRLGAFELHQQLAGGGMGVVYRASHVRDGTDVAIKVPVKSAGEQARHKSDFRREVQALARLNHPHIATIFDFGTIPESFAAHRGDDLKAGSPWLAMEYVEGEAASRGVARDGWDAFRDRMIALLDALAHAHAHGVLHRDLKPTNLIVDRDRGEIRVVDFGIAAVFESEGSLLEIEEKETVRGTPKYMAPEQVLGERNKQGPWTDLYAVGCLAWRLVCGEAPFEGETEEVLRGQLNEQPTGFEPELDVPPGFRWWLGRLLEKSPHARPRNAAYAAYQLDRIDYDADGDRPRSSQRRERLASPRSPTLGFEDDEAGIAPTQQIDPGVTADDGETVNLRSTTDFSVPQEFDPWGSPPIPSEWRRTGQRRVRPLSVSGLELFGLRRVPVADRELERDVLWTTLRRVARNGNPNAVLMTGPVGTGKSKLAEWLVRRAEEMAAGIGLEVANDSGGPDVEGIARQILEQLGIGGVAPSEAVRVGTEQLAQLGVEPDVGRYHIRGILEAAGEGKGSAETGGPPGFDDIEERNSAFRHVLKVLGERRPVILWIDDVPRARTQAQFVRSLFELSDEQAPRMLVVMTATTESWKSHVEPRTLLSPVLESTQGLTLTVNPLNDEDQREVISRMLQFEESVEEALLERTSGRPLFAVQIVSDWVERGIVQPGDDEFGLSEPLDEAMPESLEALWLRRVDEIINRYIGESRASADAAVEVAAVLGTIVDSEAWQAVCHKLDIEIPQDLVDELIEAGLATRTGETWRFAHRLLPESIRARIRASGDAEKYHRACAEELETKSTRSSAIRMLEQSVEHWQSAGELERAIETASSLFDRLRQRRWTHWAEDVLDRVAELLDEAGVDESDRRYARFRLHKAQLYLEQGRHDESEQESDAVLEQAREQDWTELVARTAMNMQELSYRRSRAEPALDALEVAEEAFVELADPLGLGRVLVNRATVLSRLKQDYEASGEALRRGRDLMGLVGNKRGVMRCKYELSIRALQEGNLEDAERFARSVLDISEEMNDKSVHCSALNALGEIERARGNLELAREYYLRTYRERRARGAKENEAIALLNVATSEVGLGEYAQARERFQSLLQRMQDSGFGAQYLAANLGLLGCAGAHEEKDRWDEIADEVRVALKRDEFRYEDHARMAELAADLAAENGWTERAEHALRISRQIWKQLQNDEEVERVDGRLADLS